MVSGVEKLKIIRLPENTGNLLAGHGVVDLVMVIITASLMGEGNDKW